MTPWPGYLQKFTPVKFTCSQCGQSSGQTPICSFDFSHLLWILSWAGICGQRCEPQEVGIIPGTPNPVASGKLSVAESISWYRGSRYGSHRQRCEPHKVVTGCCDWTNEVVYRTERDGCGNLKSTLLHLASTESSVYYIQLLLEPGLYSISFTAPTTRRGPSISQTRVQQLTLLP